MECGSLFLNLSQLGVKAVTKHVRYYMYTVTRVAAFAVWAYLMLNIDVTFEARCGYVVSGGAFWTHNFGLCSIPVLKLLPVLPLLIRTLLLFHW